MWGREREIFFLGGGAVESMDTLKKVYSGQTFGSAGDLPKHLLLFFMILNIVGMLGICSLCGRNTHANHLNKLDHVGNQIKVGNQL